ncbi:MAG: hypothetical protein JNM89_01765 [Hyphomicrobiaceae bacterium]|nr:hypothetical protein [Hyphomicrobiaceae bacterium]
MGDARLPECLACPDADDRYPCRRDDGTLDLARVAQAIVQHGRLFYDLDGELPDAEVTAPTDWVSYCEAEIVQQYPRLAFTLAIAAMDACDSVRDAAFVAAGVAEDLVVAHGPLIIDDIEKLAEHSAKFRYILSGIWSQNDSVHPDVWLRVAVAVSVGGVMSEGALCPRAGKGGKLLDEETATALLEESVTEVAISLGIIERALLS